VPFADSDYVIIGRFGAVYGVQGWLRVQSFTEPAGNLFSYQNWHIQNAQKQWQPLALENTKAHGKGYVAKIKGCNDRDLAKAYTNKEIAILKTELPDLGSDEYYWSDLVGCDVTNLQNESLGTVTQVFDTTSNDVFVVEGELRQLIPHTATAVQSIDIKTKKIIVDWDKDF
jgi:16S rRNA processing protein RimM